MGGALSTGDSPASANGAGAVSAPNGAHMNKEVTPNVCMRCRTVREACSCPNKNIVVDPVRKVKICKECRNEPEKCECAERVGRLEMLARASAPIRVRVDDMLLFFQSIESDVDVEPDDHQRMHSLADGGEALLQMHSCIDGNRNKGVITQGLIEKYHEAVGHWFAECDALNKEIFERAYQCRKRRPADDGVDRAKGAPEPEITKIHSPPAEGST